MLEVRKRLISRFLCAVLCALPAKAVAADAIQGKAIAERWCASCHLVENAQKSAPTDQAPPFTSLAARPDFSAARLALLLLEPHPNMPKLALSRSEIADLADYIQTLK